MQCPKRRSRLRKRCNPTNQSWFQLAMAPTFRQFIARSFGVETKANSWQFLDSPAGHTKYHSATSARTTGIWRSCPVGAFNDRFFRAPETRPRPARAPDPCRRQGHLHPVGKEAVDRPSVDARGDQVRRQECVPVRDPAGQKRRRLRSRDLCRSRRFDGPLVSRQTGQIATRRHLSHRCRTAGAGGARLDALAAPLHPLQIRQERPHRPAHPFDW